MKEFSGYMRGVNLGGWLSQCVHTKEHYDGFITREDFATVAAWGLDHVRIPVDYNLVEDAEGNYIESGFTYIDNAIAWAGENHLNLVLDLHKTYGFSFDSGEEETGFFENEDYQERFYRLWEEFARRYGSYKDRVAFELLNEVTDKKYCEPWNRISGTCISRIRKIAPDISILLGGYFNNSIEALKDLALPADENIVYNFHCYEPIIFTHQGAYWVDGMNQQFRMPFASTYGDYEKYAKENLNQFFEDLSAYEADRILGVEYFEAMMKEAVSVAEERNVALYCGEYGVIDLATPEDTLAWYRMIGEVFRKYGIARAAWTFRKMDFGLADARMDAIREELLKEL